MTAHTTEAVCNFCGQAMIVEIDLEKLRNMTTTEKSEYTDDYIVRNCSCDKAKAKRKEILHKNFKRFIHSEVCQFLDKFDLDEMSIKTSEGFKGKVKRDTAGNLKIETTINEVV